MSLILLLTDHHNNSTEIQYITRYPAHCRHPSVSENYKRTCGSGAELEFLCHWQPERAAGSGVARLPAVVTVVGTSGASGAFEAQLARALPVSALFDAVQQCDCEVSEGGWSPD
jgi:hypothetical protein